MEDREERKQAESDALKVRSEIRDKLSDHNSRLDDVVKRIDRIEPISEMVTGWRYRAMGALMVLGLIGAFASAFAISAFEAFRDAIINAWKDV